MRKPKLRELREAVRALVLGPYTTRFPAEPSPAAPAYRGKGVFDERECVACGACARICPSNAIEVKDHFDVSPPQREIIRHHDECIFCGQCEALCTTTKGVHLTSEYELSTLDRSSCVESIRKDLVLCEMCGEPLGTRDHLRWTALKLGAKRYANPTLILSADGALGLVGEESARRDLPPRRSDIVRMLCPKCRRTIVLREIWG